MADAPGQRPAPAPAPQAVLFDAHAGAGLELARVTPRRLPADDAGCRERPAQNDTQGELIRLPNRRRMQQAIDGALEQVRAGAEPSAVLLIDVDHLGQVGEQLLIALARRLSDALGPEDLVARYGADAFVVVARVAEEVAAHELAERLKGTLEQPLDFGGAAACMHASVGASMVRGEDPSVGAILARADAAMYAAKNKALRDAHAAGTTPCEGGRLALVEAAFERSIIEDFDVYYQPIADLHGGAVAAVEAILRWEHPELGTIAAGELLAIAERRGQMVTLGRWALEKACSQTVRWGATRDGLPMRTCISVTPSQVADPAFAEHVESALACSGATGQQLALELSDEALAGMAPGMLDVIVAAKIELILVVGTSASSLANLGPVPVSMIKLDRSFVANGPDDDVSQVLYQTAEFARGLGLRVVVEGVETLDQLRIVIENGLPLAQGNLFSRPQSAPAIEKLVHRERPFATLLAPRPAWLGLARDDQPTIRVSGGAAQ
jgi:diguanylate cyclase (GGDEF)-like protein